MLTGDQPAPTDYPDAPELDRACIAASEFFDAVWYARQYPAVAAEGHDPARHFLEHGSNAAFDPGPRFSTGAYLAAHEDVAGVGIDALLHYLRFGAAEGRTPASGVAAEDIASVRDSKWFDADWYHRSYPDVAGVGIDAAKHYLRSGAQEGRDPGPGFSTRAYLQANPDVQALNINPLLHYIRFGYAEGRKRVDTYARWIVECEKLTPIDRLAIAEHIQALEPGPLISVVVPVYNTGQSNLTDMILSVKRQLYGNWELCIADDASTRPHVWPLLKQFADSDARVRLIRRPGNGGIVASTNAALALATGAFVALLDHDDILHETALYEVASCIANNPAATLIFSDSDQIDENGRRYNPCFKQGWNRDVMLGQNLVSHLGVYRRDVITRLGGMRAGFDGSQDYDLALRVIDASEPGQIIHLPAILYHWRRATRRESFSDIAAEACIDAARRAVADHLTRDHIVARVEASPTHPQWSRVVYPVPANAPAVSIIISVDRQTLGLTSFLHALTCRTQYPNYEIVIAGDETVGPHVEIALAAARERPETRIVRRRNAMSWTQARQLAAESFRGSQILIFTDPAMHIVSSPLWLEELVSHVIRPDVAGCGPRINFRNGTIDDFGGCMRMLQPDEDIHDDDPGYFGIFCLTRDVPMLNPSCFAVRRAAFIDMGGFGDDGPSPYLAVFDLCQRLRAHGQRLIWTPFAAVEHYLDAIEQKAARDRAGDHQIFEQRLKAHIASDPLNTHLICWVSSTRRRGF